MSGGVPKRISISRTQRNTPSKAGNVMAKRAIILCNGGRSRRAICNYVKKRTHTETKKEKKEDGPPGPNWTYAPDANFRTAVVSEHPTVEVNGEYFKTSTINTITSLDVNAQSGSTNLISDLTGIEGFTALEILECADNSLTSLDVTQNTALTTLRCYRNSLNTLDVSTALERLECYGNSLISLDVTQNTALQTLWCSDNSLNTLDVSACPLTRLLCGNNNFTGGGTSVIITAFTNTYSGIFGADPQNTGINPSGDFCKVADASAQIHFDASYNASIPPGTSYFGGGVTYFPDTNFYNAIINEIGSGASAAANYLYDASINTITSLDVNGENISDLTGIEGFTALTVLNCYSNSLNALDMTQNIALTQLYCYDNSLTTLDVTQNAVLTVLHCRGNQLTSLDVSDCPLTQLYCYDNNFTGGGTSVIITAFTATFSGTFNANPQNLPVAVGPFCQVADAAAVSYFINSNYANDIPSNGTYYS